LESRAKLPAGNAMVSTGTYRTGLAQPAIKRAIKNKGMERAMEGHELHCWTTGAPAG
jgi:hypothetical protein